MQRAGDETAAGREQAESLATLIARDAIRETLYQELDAWRRRDWAAALDCWIPGAHAELGFTVETRIEPQIEQLAMAMRRFTASTWMASNCTIDLDPDGQGARCSSIVLAAHEPPASVAARSELDALRFDDRWRRDPQGAWRIAARRSESLWRAWLEPRRDDRVGDHRHAAAWEKRT